MKLWISNLDRSSQVEEIEELFAEFGQVTQVVKLSEPDKGKLTFSALVEMAYTEDAEDAMADLNGEQFDGQMIRVKPASEENMPVFDQDTEAKEAASDEVEEPGDLITIDPELVDEEDPDFEPKGWEPITRKRPGKNNRDW